VLGPSPVSSSGVHLGCHKPELNAIITGWVIPSSTDFQARRSFIICDSKSDPCLLRSQINSFPIVMSRPLTAPDNGGLGHHQLY